MSQDNSIHSHLPTRRCPPEKTCGLQWNRDPIPSCLPDIGTLVKNDRGTVGYVGYYEYYVKGQTTFPVRFPGHGQQTMTLPELVVLDPETFTPARQRFADIEAARAARNTERLDRRRTARKKPDAATDEGISARGVC
jgi:hypothetical protein